MPPERLSWDRKDFFKERKYDRPNPRWRDSSSSSNSGHNNHYGSSRDFSRWRGAVSGSAPGTPGGGAGSSDFRRPPGHGKQGSWHMFSEESGHGGGGYVPFRSSDRILEDKNCRLSISRGDGKYGRNSRDSRGSFVSQRDWKSRTWEMSNGSTNMAGRLYDASNSDQRSGEDMDHVVNYSSQPRAELSNTWDQLSSKGQMSSKDQYSLKDQLDSSDNKAAAVNGLGTGERGDRENSLDWKPLKWARSGSMSSRGSGFSHSSSSKSLGGVDSGDGKAGLEIKKSSLVQSPSGDVTACVMSAPSEDRTSRKKPRLGWGEGLAKYEKKKVEGPEVNVSKDGVLISSGTTDPIYLQNLNFADKSPRVMIVAECTSPATPSSVVCSSLGVEEKTHSKGIIAENEVTNFCCSPSVESQGHIEDLFFNLEVLDATAIANSLVKLLHFDDSSGTDSSFMRTTAMNKLLVFKSNITKFLEATETEIDSLDSELKSFNSDSDGICPCLAASGSLLVEDGGGLGEGQVPYNSIPRPSPLQVSYSGVMDKIPLSNGAMQDAGGVIKDDDADSPETATSKFVEPMSMSKAFDVVKPDECSDVDVIQTTNIIPRSYEEDIVEPACTDVSTSTRSVEGFSCRSDASIGEGNLCTSILAANKECANRASEGFSNLLPSDPCYVDLSNICTVALSQSNSIVKEKFASRKRFLRFKERVITLKFKAFQHLWEEDMRLLSIRKYRAKSQKRYELSLRTTHNGHQKNRSSIRSRFSSPVGNLSLVPTTEMLNFTSKLLSAPQVKPYRNALKMPALILDKKEKEASKFISNNGLVEDPWAVEKERTIINPWTSEEREIFLDKFATFGKDFQKISSFLDHKTTADCVEFYYRNHKSDCFQKVKKNKQVKSSTNYLMASGKNWNREMNAASLDILGAASVIAANTENGMGNKQMSSGRMYLTGYGGSKRFHSDEGNLDKSSNCDTPENERETAAADVLAGICGSISSEAMSSCITTLDHVEVCRDWKSQKVSSVKKRSSTSDVTENADEETCSDESCGEMDAADWTDEEKSVFIQAISTYGKDFAKISRCVRTRSRDQCKVFFSKARKCLGLDSIHPASGDHGPLLNDDANGGGSDTEDGCAIETCSVICSDKFGSKMYEEVSLDGKLKEPYSAERNLSDNAVLLDPDDSKAGKKFDSDACLVDCKPELTSAGDAKVVDGSVCQSEVTQAQEISNESVSSGLKREKPIDRGTSVGDAVRPNSSNLDSVVDVKVMEEVSIRGGENLLQGKKLLLPEIRLNSRMEDSNFTRSVSNLASDMGSSSNYSPSSENLHHVSVEFDSVEKPRIFSLQLENSLAAATSMLQNSATSQCGKLKNHDKLSSQLVKEESEGEDGQKSVCMGDHFSHFPVQSLVSCSESQQILGVYPDQIPIRKEMNGEISCGSHLEVQKPSNSECSRTNQLVAQSPRAELPLLSQQSEQGDDRPTDDLRSTLDMEKPCKNGDVKLFGKILSNSSSAQKSNPNIHENVEQESHDPKPASKSSTLKFTGHQPTDGSTSVLKFDYNYLGLENVPVKSYGFWDGSKIQTGFSSVPEYFLAKYPAAFTNYHPSNSKIEQAAVNCNDHNLNSVSVLPPREISNGNSVMDYQTKLQQLKQRHDMFSDIQRMNRFEGISSLQQQQQGRGIVGVNVAGRMGSIVGVPCPVVSDPVAALQMHYAKSEPFGGQKGSMIREEESWRSNGDIGR